MPEKNKRNLTRENSIEQDSLPEAENRCEMSVSHHSYLTSSIYHLFLSDI